MFTVQIRDHIMIAHSLAHPDFGKASQLHGATYMVDVEFQSPHLNEMNVVIDMGLAHKILNECLEPLRFVCLDQVDEFKGVLTTTEFLAYHIHSKIGQHPLLRFRGNLKVSLEESYRASASYSQQIG
jgi:6-pyruvoyltetrahydropterin/6-carboxytetrahydropterin synthase